MNEHRQYICLKCMSFIFAGELMFHDTEDPEYPPYFSIPIQTCPKCGEVVHYCGAHKDRGSSKLFGSRIANLEYIEAMNRKTIEDPSLKCSVKRTTFRTTLDEEAKRYGKKIRQDDEVVK